jgi:hypothetical protein
MSGSALGPRHGHLKQAIAWLAEQGGWTLERIEEACQRFDLSPADEEFLIREFRRLQDPGQP